MRVLDLFSGIGGFSLGLKRAGGFQTVAYCEIDPYCQQVLQSRMAEGFLDPAPICTEIRAFDGGLFRSVEVIVGGFPCQDISAAGLKAGIDGGRSGLWREMHRIIRQVRPQYVIVENVAALLARGLGRVLGDLASSGYDAEWDCIPASAVGAPHRRDRVWIVAYPERLRWSEVECKDGGGAQGGGASSATLQRRVFSGRIESRWEPEPQVGRVAHGVPDRVDRITALGNAVVPQVVEWIGRRIQESLKMQRG